MLHAAGNDTEGSRTESRHAGRFARTEGEKLGAAQRQTKKGYLHLQV